MGVSKAYRVQIYPPRQVHILLKQLAKESGQTVSKTAVSLIEQALNNESTLHEIRNVQVDQKEIYQQLINLLSINVATTEFLLKKTCSEDEMAEAKQVISARTNALRSHFIGGDDNGND
ncbi:hypothetical protein [Vibrio vulnificus]|uniref:hypothetical protein n=1 Tax=Vibrio vulnificus TaxID=672 RepID=UPI00051D5C5E|nr:hypothetical protein [Vibrio vulnificus]KGK68153.1 hypothetical protein NA76_22780 [Vibrio vulnificus]